MARVPVLVALVLCVVAGACGDDGASVNDNTNNGNQSQSICGDGRIEGTEACDDGPANSDVTPDACRTDCRLPGCGDGTVDSGEACDDGTRNSDRAPDVCRTSCQLPRCGDGVVDESRGEACDPGTPLPTTTCSADCRLTYCGNGVVDPNEVCDDGNTTSGDGCSANCQSDESCGNGILDVVSGELCDCGDGSEPVAPGCNGFNSDAPGATCSLDCVTRYCGNGVVNAGEVCDDGNTMSGDGCSANCQSDESCGNGITDPAAGEACDCGDGSVPFSAGCDGPNSNAPGATCHPDCTPHRCGDGLIEAPEECDGASLGGATCDSVGYYGGSLGCTPLCQWDRSGCVGTCGDGVVDGPEECEGEPPAGESCVGYGYDTGTLRCSDRCLLDFRGCRRIGWEWLQTGLTDHFYDVWGSGPRDVYAVGMGGAIAHFDGVRWTDLSTQGTAYYSVWGSGPGDVYAAGFDGLLSHWDGSSWSTLATPTTSWFRFVWGASAADVLLAFGDTVGHDLVRWNGTAWTTLIDGAPGELRDAGGTAADDIWIATDGLRHWNGTAWSAITVPFPGTVAVASVWARSATDVLAVSILGQIARHNGSTWTIKDPGLIDNASRIRGSHSDHVMVTAGYTYVTSYNGRDWTRQEAGHSGNLNGLWVWSPRLAYVGGGAGTVGRYRGTGWVDPATTRTAATCRLGPVWASSTTDVHTLCADTTPTRALRWNGTTWTEASLASAGTATAIWGSSASQVFALSSGGSIHRWNGSAWMVLSSPTTSTLNAVWGSSAASAFAVGDGGVIVRWNGTAWSTMTSGTTQTLRGVWGTSGTDVWAVGDGGTLRHWDGTAWSAVNSGTTAALDAIWGTAVGEVLIAGAGGTVLRRSGATWVPMDTGTSDDVVGLCGVLGSDLFAVAGGSLLIRDGDRFVPLASPIAEALAGCYETQHAAFFVGGSGVVLRLDHRIEFESSEQICDDGVDEDGDGLRDCADPDCGFHPACQ